MHGWCVASMDGSTKGTRYDPIHRGSRRSGHLVVHPAVVNALIRGACPLISIRSACR